MNCPHCSRPMVSGTVVDQDGRHHYLFCPHCREVSRSESKIDGKPQFANPPNETDVKESVRRLLEACQGDPRKHQRAWAALQAWHTCAIRTVKLMAGDAVGLAEELDNLRAEMVAVLRDIADGKDGGG